jgi:hypothetical protein
LGAVYTPTWGGVGTSRRDLGLKSFELANHLGNVLVTVSDKPVYKVSITSIFFQPEITSTSDYYPFGAPIQGRSAAFGGEYRFGFNTQEKTDEISGPGNHNTATKYDHVGGGKNSSFWDNLNIGRMSWWQGNKTEKAQANGGGDPYGVNRDNGNNYNGWNATREVAGTAMIILGSPIVNKNSTLAKAIWKESRVVLGASKNTSVASLAARRLSKSNTAFKLLGTKSLGGIAGRFVPWVGWSLLAYDIYDNREAIMWGAQQAGYGMGERQTLMQQYPFDIPVCFVKGTLVYTILGLSPIEKIAVGDSVYSYNLEKNIVEKSKVVKVFEREAKETYLLNTNKEQIEVTAEHPFYVENKGWVKVKDLQTNYILKTENNKTELVKINILTKEEKVFNIEVEGNHNYFISKSKILVHNK